MTARFLAAALLLLAPQIAIAETSSTDDDNRYVMSISGGISLGAYDAGRNWIFLKHLERLRADRGGDDRVLAAVTGASAGSINAFITALYWCSTIENRPLGDTLDANAYKALWTAMGFESLLPTRDGGRDLDFSKYDLATGGGHRDGVLARGHATGALLRKLEAWLGHPGGFRSNCRIPFGVAVTRAEPLDIAVFSESRYSLPAQTLYASFELVVDDDGNAKIVMAPMAADRRAVTFDDHRYRFDGYHLLLPGPVHPGDGRTGNDPMRRRVVTFDQVRDVLYASSAFPIAFGRVYIDHCLPYEMVRPGASHRPGREGHCPDGHTLVTGEAFVDGGVLDNVPIGMAVALAPDGPAGDKEDLRFFYVDPNIRRGDVTDCPRDRDGSCVSPGTHEPGYGLLDQLAFVGGTYSVFDTANRARPLRDLCMPQDPIVDDPRTDSNCRGRAIVATRALPITGKMAGHFGAFFDQRFAEYDFAMGVYDGLYALPACGTDLPSGRSILCRAEQLGLVGEKGWADVAWLAGDASEPKTPDFVQIRRALDFAQSEERGRCGARGCTYYTRAHFKLFATGLHSEGFDPRSPLLTEALAQPDVWYAGVARLAMSRLRWLEDRAKLEGGRSLKPLIAWADIYLQELLPKRGWDLNPTVNERLSLVPYDASLNIKDRGLYAGYRPMYHASKGWRWEFPLGAMYQHDVRSARWQGVAGVNLRLPFGTDYGYRMGIGYRAFVDLSDIGGGDGFAHGPAVYVDLVSKIRIEYSMSDAPWGRQEFVHIGIIDLPALFPRFSKRLLRDD